MSGHTVIEDGLALKHSHCLYASQSHRGDTPALWLWCKPESCRCSTKAGRTYFVIYWPWAYAEAVIRVWMLLLLFLFLLLFDFWPRGFADAVFICRRFTLFRRTLKKPQLQKKKTMPTYDRKLLVMQIIFQTLWLVLY